MIVNIMYLYLHLQNDAGRQIDSFWKWTAFLNLIVLIKL